MEGTLLQGSDLKGKTPLIASHVSEYSKSQNKFTAAMSSSVAIPVPLLGLACVYILLFVPLTLIRYI